MYEPWLEEGLIIVGFVFVLERTSFLDILCALAHRLVQARIIHLQIPYLVRKGRT